MTGRRKSRVVQVERCGSCHERIDRCRCSEGNPTIVQDGIGIARRFLEHHMDTGEFTDPYDGETATATSETMESEVVHKLSIELDSEQALLLISALTVYEIAITAAFGTVTTVDRCREVFKLKELLS